MVFIASPGVITFQDYKVGQVYEMVLEFKNVTSVLRPIRIVPPKTQYFSVGLGKYGLIVEGLSRAIDL